MDLTPLNDLLKEQPELGPLAFKESSGFADARRVNADNREFAGLFQIGAARLQDLKEDGVVPENATLQTLMDDPALYARAANAHFDDYRQSIRNPNWKWNQYVGTEVDGVPVTETGLMYAMHLAGRGGTEKFLKTGTDPSDELGTSISDYLRLGARVESDEPDPELMTVFRARLRDRAEETAAAEAPAEEPTAEPAAAAETAAAPAEEPTAAAPAPLETTPAAVVAGETTPAAQPVTPVQEAAQQRLEEESVRRAAQRDQEGQPPGGRSLVSDTIEGAESNPLTPILREAGMNQAANYPLSRMLREGYTSSQMVNSLLSRTGMDPRWPSLVEQAREYGLSDDTILGAMIGASDDKFLAMVEGGVRGGVRGLTAAQAAKMGAKIGFTAAPGVWKFPAAIFGAATGLIGGSFLANTAMDVVGPEITEYTPQARIAFNAAETTAEIIGVTPAFRALPSGMQAVRSAKVETARRVAESQGRFFDEGLVNVGRMEKMLNAVARNVGAPGSLTRARFNQVEGFAALLGGAGAASAQAMLPENVWARVAFEVGGGLGAAPLNALTGLTVNGLKSGLGTFSAGTTRIGAEESALRILLTGYTSQGNAVVTPRIFREALESGEQEKVLREINENLRERAIASGDVRALDDEIPSVAVFRDLPEQAQRNLLTDADGNWAYRATITQTNFANVSRGLRAEILRTSGPALIELRKNMARAAREAGISPESVKFLPRELMMIAEGLAKKDVQFGTQLDAQKRENLEQMLDAMRAVFDGSGTSKQWAADPANAQATDVSGLLQAREELFKQIFQELIESSNRQAATIVADKYRAGYETAETFANTLRNLYTSARKTATDEANRLYALLPDSMPITVNNFRARVSDPAVRVGYSSQLPPDRGPLVGGAYRATTPGEVPEVDPSKLVTEAGEEAVVTGKEPPPVMAEALNILAEDLRAVSTRTDQEKKVLAELEDLIARFNAAQDVEVPLRQVRRLREQLYEKASKEYTANGYRANNRSRYFREAAEALSDDIDAVGVPELDTANAFYRAMMTTFAESLGDSVNRYLSPMNKQMRDVGAMIDALVPTDPRNISMRWDELDSIVQFMARNLVEDAPPEVARLAETQGITNAGLRDNLLNIAAEVLFQKAVKKQGLDPTKPITLDNIDLDKLNMLRIEYRPMLDRMPIEARQLFDDPIQMLTAINQKRGTLKGLDSGRLPLSVTFGTEDRQFNNLLDVLSGDSNLLGEGRFPFEYATSASGSELLAMLSDRARVSRPQKAFDEFTRLIATLADEADKGPLSRGIFERILNSGKFPDIQSVMQSADPKLVQAMDNLDELRQPLSGYGRPSGERLRNGLKRAFADYALTYDKAQNVSFKALSSRALFDVGTAGSPTVRMDELAKNAPGRRSQDNSMVAILHKNGIITTKQREGIEDFLHFSTELERIMTETKPLDVDRMLAQTFEQKAGMDLLLRYAGSALGAIPAQILGNPQSLVMAYAGSRAMQNAFGKTPIAHVQKIMKELLLSGGLEDALELFMKNIETIDEYEMLIGVSDRLAAMFFTPRLTAAAMSTFQELPGLLIGEEDTSNVPTKEELRQRTAPPPQVPAPPQAAAPQRPARPPMFAPPPPEPSPLNFQQDFPELFAQQQQPQQAAPGGPANPMAGAQLFPNDPMFQQRGIQALMRG